MAADRYSVLSYDQVKRLQQFLQQPVRIHGRNCPTLSLTLIQLLQRVCDRLKADRIKLRDVRLNGSSASYIIGKDAMQSYNDLDLLFGVELDSAETMDTIKCCVLDCLKTFQAEPDTTTQHERHPSGGGGVDGYVRKLARIQSTDSWSLISLGNAPVHDCSGATVELKFVDKMRRKFEFTVDSFQIVLDSLLTFFKLRPDDEEAQSITQQFYPTVVAESVSGSFEEAYKHLIGREISTRNPEEIRGGGLLKYCKLLVDGFVPADGVDVTNLEKYMCSRFFIDFPDAGKQKGKVQSYLLAHFPCDKDLQLRVQYLQVLHAVVKSSTVCLMQQERRSTLYLIADMIGEVCMDIESRKNIIALEPFNSEQWVLDQVYYGTQLFPTHLTAIGLPATIDSCDDVASPSASSGYSCIASASNSYSCIASTSSGHVKFAVGCASESSAASTISDASSQASAD